MRRRTSVARSGGTVRRAARPPAFEPLWRPLLATDADGTAKVSFTLPPSAGTFRLLVEAHGAGRVGAATAKIVARGPLQVRPKTPQEVSAGDRIDLPVTVVNDSRGHLPVQLTIAHHALLKLDGPPQRNLELAAGASGREFFALEVVGRQGECELSFRCSAGDLTETAERHVRIAPPPDRGDSNPAFDAQCGLRLATALAQPRVKAGETVTLRVEVTNVTDEDRPSVAAVIGIPGGLEFREEQIERLRQSGVIASYEIRPRELTCVWRVLAPGQQIPLQLELTAAVPGKYTGPASRVYSLSSPGVRQWTEPLAVEIVSEMASPGR